MRRGTSKEYLKGTRRHGAYRFPLTKFLFSRVGRLWNDVHSELSQEFDRRTYVGYTFWKWGLKWEVAQNCWIGAETGTIYDGESEVNGFYVHPFTGILCYSSSIKRYNREAKPVTRFQIDDKRAYEKIEGIWYYTEYCKNEYYHPYSQQSLLFPERPFTVLAKRQLSRKELQHLTLVNDNPEKIQEDKEEAEKKRKELKKIQEMAK